MKPTHIEHIGIAVRSLAEAIPTFEKILGVSCRAIEEVADQKTLTAVLQLGATKIELLESTSDDGPIARFIEKRGEGIHHIALALRDVAGARAAAQVQGLELVDMDPSPGAEGLLVSFLHPRSAHGVLIELCSKE